MAISVECDGKVVTIIGSGELDYLHAQELKKALAEMRVSPEEDLIFDFRNAVRVNKAVLECVAVMGRERQDPSKRLKVLVCESTHPFYKLQTLGFADFVDIVVEPAAAENTE